MEIGSLVEVSNRCQVRSLHGMRGIVTKVPQSVIDGTLGHTVFQVSVLLPHRKAIFNSYDLKTVS